MEKDNKTILEALERLRRNADYQYLCTHLKTMLFLIESNIFNENLAFETKSTLIIKRNVIKNFIELPEDLIKQFEITN